VVIPKQRLVCVVRDDRTGSEHTIPLAHEPGAWPHVVGGSPGCAIHLADLPPRAAEITGQSNHFFVRPLVPVAIKAHGRVVAEGQEERFQVCSIGPYTLRMTWVDAE
jgi:hypothetical protein